MRVVLDSNVLVSGLITPAGPCGHVLRLAFGGPLQPCVDNRILHEYETVLTRPRFRIHPDDIADALEIIRLRSERILPPPLTPDLPDKSDLPFLEVAAFAPALLITGNLRHFPPRLRQSVTVLSPREFLDFLQRPE
jgi:putative PIN family toxin of toxin-antitoxin system